MNAIEDNGYHHAWRALGQALPRPKAILCISAHWETIGVQIGGAIQPETIHDFGGFPQALFDVQYPAPGSAWLTERTADLLANQYPIIDQVRGIDHGVWGVLIALYPQADIPVIQLSLDMSRPAADHYKLAQALRPLRDEGVLILGSGNIVHNLSAIDFRNPKPLDWALRFIEEAKRLIASGDHDQLCDLAALGPDAALAINSAEHYLPLLYVLGASDKGEALRFITDETFAAISMTGVVIGG
jgi:4,5-DOPA dioxygenase extradiol